MGSLPVRRQIKNLSEENIRKWLGNKIIVPNPRLVATTMTFGVNRVERKMPEKRPERKLTQRVVVNEAA